MGRGGGARKQVRDDDGVTALCRGTVALQRTRPFGNLACSSGGGCYIDLFDVLARVLRERPNSSRGSLL